MTSSDEAEQTKPDGVPEGAPENAPDEAPEEVKDTTASSDADQQGGETDQGDAGLAVAEDGADTDPAAERDELKDQLLRLMADNENLRKRTERDMAAAKKYGALGLARDLLASIDNLETAISHMPENKEDMDETLKNILIGVEMSAREFATVLERHQITKLTPEGEKFDYNLHQAMFEVPTDEVAPGMVVQVVQSGYMLHDRLLRPAMVGVSKPAAQAATPAADKDS